MRLQKNLALITMCCLQAGLVFGVQQEQSGGVTALEQPACGVIPSKAFHISCHGDDSKDSESNDLDWYVYGSADLKRCVYSPQLGNITVNKEDWSTFKHGRMHLATGYAVDGVIIQAVMTMEESKGEVAPSYSHSAYQYIKPGSSPITLTCRRSYTPYTALR